MRQSYSAMGGLLLASVLLLSGCGEESTNASSPGGHAGATPGAGGTEPNGGSAGATTAAGGTESSGGSAGTTTGAGGTQPSGGSAGAATGAGGTQPSGGSAGAEPGAGGTEPNGGSAGTTTGAGGAEPSGGTAGAAAGAGGSGPDGGSAGTTTGAGGQGSGGDIGVTGGPVELSGVTNARQTGGLTTSSGQRVRDDVIIRSGHLGSLDSTGCDQFEALGINTIIDLRDAADAAQTPDAACATSTAVYFNADIPRLLPPSEQIYLDTLDAIEPVLDEIFAQLAAADALPVVIHCVIGRDRASLVTAIVLLALGVPEDQVLADFELNQDASVTTDAAWMSGVLQRIDDAGGIEAYLDLHGVTSAQLTALRTMALE